MYNWNLWMILTGDFKIDCDDRQAVVLINIVNPKQENIEEVIVNELMHIKMYPLDQVTESLIINCFEEDSPASNFSYQQFYTALEQTVEELAKCFYQNMVIIKIFHMIIFEIRTTKFENDIAARSE